MKKISVIVPVYNVEKYLKRCIDSIVGQSYENLEIILIDDGSTDKSGCICDVYKEKYYNINVVHKENGGLSSARNKGLDLANGDYVVFVDSDDWLPKESISCLYSLIENDKSDFAMGQFCRCGNIVDTKTDGKGRYNSIYSSAEFLKLFFKVGTQENVQYVCAKIFKKELFATIRFPLGVIDEDVPTMFNIILKSKTISYTSRIVYYYYLNPNSITLSNFSRKKFDLLKVWDMVCESSKNNDCETWIKTYAELNRKRANFGVLCNIVCSAKFQENEIKFKKEINELVSVLKKDLLLLMKSPIPISRKVIMIMFCVSFHYFGYCINKLWEGWNGLVRQ